MSKHNDIATFISVTQRERGLTFKDMAALAGVSVRAANKSVYDIDDVTIEDIAKIVSALGGKLTIKLAQD